MDMKTMNDEKKSTVILLSGGIGSGKSAVRRILEGMGVPCYDADSAVKDFYKVPPERTATAFGAESRPERLGSGGSQKPFLLPEVESALGQEFRRADGQFANKALAAVIFSDSGKLKTVENIVFPALVADFERWRKSSDMASVPDKALPAEAESVKGGSVGIPGLTAHVPVKPTKAPLSADVVIFESATALDKPDFPKVWDKCLWVDAPEEVRIERVMARDHCTREQVLSRLLLQSPLEAHRSEIDAIILNDCTLPELSSRVRSVLNCIMHPLNQCK